MTPPENDATGKQPPILRYKSHHAASVFTPEALLREARRQKGIGAEAVPDICLLDPDGDIVRPMPLLPRVANRCFALRTSLEKSSTLQRKVDKLPLPISEVSP
jgi:hypothetical protein